MNLDKVKKIYLIGIKGVGMTMLAQFLNSKGFEVEGSDTEETFMTDEVLKDQGIKVKTGFSIENLKEDIDLVIYSTAYTQETNSELKYVLENKDMFHGIFSYAEALGEIFSQHQGIAVVGSHGKTTTSALLGYTFQLAGLKPNVLVGSKVKQFKGNILTGKSDYFICEVDEYQDKLKYFFPDIAVLNNIDYDHHDYFKNEEEYVQAFTRFVKKIKPEGFLVANTDNKKLKPVIQVSQGKVLGYGLSNISTFFKNQEFYLQAYDLKLKNNYQYFKVKKYTSQKRSYNLGEFQLKLLGEHNVLNALAVLSLSVKFEIPLEKVKRSFSSFLGTSRRQEILGKYKKTIIIDDYAHHPTEIKYTLKTLKEKYKEKELVTVFHPHTYTRTKALLEEFSESFSETDKLIVLDIYGSAREEQGGVSSQELVEKIKVKNPSLEVKYIPTIEEVITALKQSLKPNQVLVLMGAGDVFRVGESLVIN